MKYYLIKTKTETSLKGCFPIISEEYEVEVDRVELTEDELRTLSTCTFRNRDTEICRKIGRVLN